MWLNQGYFGFVRFRWLSFLCLSCPNDRVGLIVEWDTALYSISHWIETRRTLDNFLPKLWTTGLIECTVITDFKMYRLCVVLVLQGSVETWLGWSGTFLWLTVYNTVNIQSLIISSLVKRSFTTSALSALFRLPSWSSSICECSWAIASKPTWSVSHSSSPARHSASLKSKPKYETYTEMH